MAADFWSVLPELICYEICNFELPFFRSVMSYEHICKLVVGISATMCHSAEKIPAKEGCQSKRVSKKQQSYPSRGLK